MRRRPTIQAKKLATDREMVLCELAEIAVMCRDTTLEEVDIKRLNLKRQTLGVLYQALTERKKEQETEDLITSVRQVEHLWSIGFDDVGERESMATKFSHPEGSEPH
jgi:hypothetical protein